MKRAGSKLLITGVLLALASGAAAQKLYKWVDEDGNVHYSDQVPPDQVDKAREELNEQGVVVDRTARAPTAEELAEQARLASEADAERRRLERLHREDQKLLMMYPSVEDIIRIKEEQVDAINRSITAAEAYKEGQAKSLADLLERAGQMESNGKAVSEALTSQIKSLQSQIAEQEHFIAGRIEERERIVVEYGDLIERYREVRSRNS